MLTRRATPSLVILLVAAIGTTGCTQRQGSLPHLWNIRANEPVGATAISREVVLLADNQLHNLYADEVKVFRTGLGDKISQAAIRSVQLDYFGQDFLELIVKQQGKQRPIVHLGDACDFSCSGEFVRFCNIMRGAKEGWFMAPGNHDTMFYGNTHPRLGKSNWRAACHYAGEPLLEDLNDIMTKDVFVRLYVAALMLQENLAEMEDLAGVICLTEARERFRAELDGSEDGSTYARALVDFAALVPPEGDWSMGGRSESNQPLLTAISWRIFEKAPWRSYVVQQLDLTRHHSQQGTRPYVRAVLLDTCQYGNAPTLLPLPPLTVNAGMNGELLSDQLSIVDGWVEREPTSDVFWVLMGHHPFDWLRVRARWSLDRIRKAAKSVLYVSAHTHKGHYIVHGQGDDAWLELNVGSILDWPSECRYLQFLRDGDHVVLMSRRRELEELLGTQGLPDAKPGWEAKPDDPDYYLAHAVLTDLDAAKADVVLKTALLAAHDRMLQYIETDTQGNHASIRWPSGCRTVGEVRQRIEKAMERLEAAPEVPDDIVRLLVELERFDRSRAEKCGDGFRRYRLSQAIWASQYDSAHDNARKLHPDVEYIQIPMEAIQHESRLRSSNP